MRDIKLDKKKKEVQDEDEEEIKDDEPDEEENKDDDLEEELSVPDAVGNQEISKSITFDYKKCNEHIFYIKVPESDGESGLLTKIEIKLAKKKAAWTDVSEVK